jgi:hypothetical protein
MSNFYTICHKKTGFSATIFVIVEVFSYRCSARRDSGISDLHKCSSCLAALKI